MKHIQLEINSNTDWSVAGDKFRKVEDSKYNIRKYNEGKRNTLICCNTYDSGGKTIGVFLSNIIPNKRLDTHLPINTDIPIQNEEYLVSECNRRIDNIRKEYNDLFLTISFSYDGLKAIQRYIIYSILEQILKEYDETHTT